MAQYERYKNNFHDPVIFPMTSVAGRIMCFKSILLCKIAILFFWGGGNLVDILPVYIVISFIIFRFRI